MPFQHHKRFRPAESFPPIHLTERDTEILRLLRRYRFLRSSHITALLDGSDQQLLRRLQKLYHHGYVERPLSQLDYFVNGGSRRMIYGLGARGVAYLHRIEMESKQRNDWGYRNRRASRLFLDHALMVSDILVNLLLAAQDQPIVKFTPALDGAESARSYDWRVRMQSADETRVIPDAAFVLETLGARQNQRVLCLLEADRGTMPVISKNPHRSSIRRKLVAYQRSFDERVFSQRFGFQRVQVLTITSSIQRLDTISDVMASTVRTSNLFFFGHYSEVTSDPAAFLSRLTHRLVFPQRELFLTQPPDKSFG